MKSRSRKEILEDLILHNGETQDLLKELSAYSWDEEEELVEISSETLFGTLSSFLRESSDFAAEVECWANAVECRDDIGFENDTLQQYIHELANPMLFDEITQEKVNLIVDTLRGGNDLPSS